MVRRMFSRFTAAGLTDAADQLAKIREWSGNPAITHRDKLSITEANAVLEQLDALIRTQSPPEGGSQ
jgi:hypothetical protein